MLRKILFALYALTIVCMGAATFIEKDKGTPYVGEHIYGAWWFTALWAALTAAGILYIIRCRMRRPAAVAVHLSFAVILLGALVTHASAVQGVVHLRMNETTDKYLTLSGDEVREHPLPFTLRLTDFNTTFYHGTDTPQDYETRFTITDATGTHPARVSMNNIYSHRGYRFYQNDYDRDMRGSILSVNADPWGIAITYTGYAMLFIALIWMLADPKGTFRTLLRSPLLRRGALSAALLAAMAAGTQAAPTLPRETADRFGRLHILSAGRICPVQTFAIDFTRKVYGAATYNGLTAEQVLAGWLFWGDEWADEPFIKVKSGAMRDALQLPGHVSLNTFFNRDMGGYILGPYVEEYYRGNRDAFHKQVADTDDRLMLLMQLRRGAVLKLFPVTDGGRTAWYAPTDKLPSAVSGGRAAYITGVLGLLYGEAQAGNTAKVDEIIGKMADYQRQNGGASLPTETQSRAERLYNAVPFATALFIVCLTMGFLLLLAWMARLSGESLLIGRNGRIWPIVQRVSLGVMLAAFAALTLCEALRWVISGNIPMSNGYETMLLVAWLVMLLSIIASRRFRIALAFGFLMAGFFLLVSHINRMDPAITNIMPVLNSPLLSVHVSVIMLAFALLSLTFICGVTALLADGIARIRAKKWRTACTAGEPLEALRLLSRLLLYPALATLCVGIFVGAVWANVSWGRYWSWDAKETWALITLMVYATAAHTATLPALRNPRRYHLFMVLAFITILMTYFGVNYYLGSGMHTYA